MGNEEVPSRIRSKPSKDVALDMTFDMLVKLKLLPLAPGFAPATALEPLIHNVNFFKLVA